MIAFFSCVLRIGRIFLYKGGSGVLVLRDGPCLLDSDPSYLLPLSLSGMIETPLSSGSFCPSLLDEDLSSYEDDFRSNFSGAFSRRCSASPCSPFTGKRFPSNVSFSQTLYLKFNNLQIYIKILRLIASLLAIPPWQFILRRYNPLPDPPLISHTHTHNKLWERFIRKDIDYNIFLNSKKKWKQMTYQIKGNRCANNDLSIQWVSIQLLKLIFAIIMLSNIRI